MQADPVGEREGILLVVRDDQRRGTERLEQRAQFADQALAQRHVEARERLVEQQVDGTRRERARHRDALLLAAGELRGVRVGAVREADQLEHLHARARVAPCRPSALRPNSTLPSAVRCGNSAWSWNTSPMPRSCGGTCTPGALSAAARAGYVPRVERLEAGDAAQCRGLAAAARARAGSRSRLPRARSSARRAPCRSPKRRSRVAQLKPHG